MQEQTFFRGGIFADQLTKRPTRGQILLEPSGLAIQTEEGKFTLPYEDCQLELGGDGGHILFCRNLDRSLVIFCEDRSFLLAIKDASSGKLDSQIDGLLKKRKHQGRLSALSWMVVLLALVGVVLGGYYGIMAGARAAVLALPLQIDKMIGDNTLKTMTLDGPKVEDPVVVGAVQSIVDRLAPHYPGGPFDFQITVVDAPIENAFALPGGQMVIYTGLLKSAKTPEEVAGVLAHEMAHVAKRHGMQRVGQSIGIYSAISFLLGDVNSLVGAAVSAAGTGALQSYSREHESEADAEGVKALHKAGINPKGLADFFQTMKDEHGDIHKMAVWMSSHPQHEMRISAVRNQISNLPTMDYQPLDINWKEVKKHLR